MNAQRVDDAMDRQVDPCVDGRDVRGKPCAAGGLRRRRGEDARAWDRLGPGQDPRDPRLVLEHNDAAQQRLVQCPPPPKCPAPKPQAACECSPLPLCPPPPPCPKPAPCGAAAPAQDSSKQDEQAAAAPRRSADADVSSKTKTAAVLKEMQDVLHQAAVAAQAAEEADGPHSPDSLLSLESWLASPHMTHQTCYMGADETEMCVYDGPLCFDGENALVVVPWDPPGEAATLPTGHTPGAVAPAANGEPPLLIGTPLNRGDALAQCYDFRYYEASAPDFSKCSYNGPFDRPYGAHDPLRHAFFTPLPEDQPLRADIAADFSAEWREPGISTSYPATKRRWGPAQRGALYFRELHADAVFGHGEEAYEMHVHSNTAAGKSQGQAWAIPPVYVTTGDPYNRPHIAATSSRIVDSGKLFPGAIPPGMRNAGDEAWNSRVRVTVDWLDAPLWLSALDAQYHWHPYHFATRALALYDAMRNNASLQGWEEGPFDGLVQPLSQYNWPLDRPLHRTPVPGTRTNIGAPKPPTPAAAGVVGAAAVAGAGAGIKPPTPLITDHTGHTHNHSGHNHTAAHAGHKHPAAAAGKVPAAAPAAGGAAAAMRGLPGAANARPPLQQQQQQAAAPPQRPDGLAKPPRLFAPHSEAEDARPMRPAGAGGAGGGVGGRKLLATTGSSEKPLTLPYDASAHVLPAATTAHGSPAARAGKYPEWPRARFRPAGQWDLPEMGYLAFAGPGAVFQSINNLGALMRSLLTLSTQRHTRILGLDVLKPYKPPSVYKPNATTLAQRAAEVATAGGGSKAAAVGSSSGSNPETEIPDGVTQEVRLLCSRRGAMTGTKNRFFNSRADAELFRQYAYDMAAEALGQQLRLAHPHRAPRTITIFTRRQGGGREYANEAAVIAAANATGLPVRIIADMGRLPFPEQVAAMSDTGILIAAHGAALVNAMFLPSHAVVIEIFPYYMKKFTYYNLAAIMGLMYFPLYSLAPPPGMPETVQTGLPPPPASTISSAVPAQALPAGSPKPHYGIQLLTNPAFTKTCLERNVSTVDALLAGTCNAASKASAIAVDVDRLTETLRHAADMIGAYSTDNKDWRR